MLQQREFLMTSYFSLVIYQKYGLSQGIWHIDQWEDHVTVGRDEKWGINVTLMLHHSERMRRVETTRWSDNEAAKSYAVTFRRREGNSVPRQIWGIVSNFSSPRGREGGFEETDVGFYLTVSKFTSLTIYPHTLRVRPLRTTGRVWITTQVSSPSSLRWIVTIVVFSHLVPTIIPKETRRLSSKKIP